MRGLPLPRPCHLPQGPRPPRILPESPARPGCQAFALLFPQCHRVVPSAPCAVVSDGRCFTWHMSGALCDMGDGAEL